MRFPKPGRKVTGVAIAAREGRKWVFNSRSSFIIHGAVIAGKNGDEQEEDLLPATYLGNFVRESE